MNPIDFAMRRPLTVMVAVVAVALGSGLAVRRMPIDIFPNLNLPVIYVCQPYGGMDPAQMEGLLTNYYEYHFLYIAGIHHVESRERPGHGPDEARSSTPARTWPRRWPRRSATSPARGPSCRRGPSRRSSPASTPAASRSATSSSPARRRRIGEIQDQALFKVRPMFASLPGVSAPPPFGGSQRTVVVRIDPDRLRSYAMSPDEVIKALTAGNVDQPLGQRPDRRRDADRAGQLAGQGRRRAADDPDPARREPRPSTSATSPPCRTPPTSRSATPSSTAAGPSTSS